MIETLSGSNEYNSGFSTAEINKPENIKSPESEKLWTPEQLLTLPDTTALFDKLLSKKESLVIIFNFTKEGSFEWEGLENEYYEFDQIAKTIVNRQLQEDFTRFRVRCNVRRSGEWNSADDEWHIDGATKYLLANKNPTLYLPDLNKKYNKQLDNFNLKVPPDPSDIEQYPINTLVRQQSETIHRRDPRAIGDKDRYLLSIVFFE